MSSDDLRTAIGALEASKISDAIKKAESSGDPTLGSGRTASETLELAEELIGVIRERWEDDGFGTLPVPIRNNLQTRLDRLRARLDDYVAGTEAAQVVDSEVDPLHTLLWQNAIYPGTTAERVFSKKSSQLDRLKNKGRRINRELKEGLKFRDQLKAASETIENVVADAREQLSQAQANLKEITEKQASATQAAEDATASSQELARLEASGKEILGRISQAESEVGALKEKVKLFHSSIEERQSELEALFESAGESVDDLQARADAIVSRHEELQVEVDTQLQKAAGASLFHAFQARQAELTKAKWIWAGISVVVLVGTVVWSLFLAQSAATLDTAFFVKLGGTLPVLAVVVFCLSQYGRERRAEEEHAFKSSLSLSLVPYKDLVEGIETSGIDAEYAKFLTETIRQIYSPPRLAKESTGKPDRTTLRVMEAVNELVERIVNR